VRSSEIGVNALSWTWNMLLETSFIVDLLAGRREAVELAAELDALAEPARVPAPTAFELWTGAAGSIDEPAELVKIEQFLHGHEIVPFDARAARQAGEIQGNLSAKGRPLGTIDVQVAGIAQCRGELLVTGDKRLLGLETGLSTRAYRRRPRT
jgi:tRNA(fMet)-specific endonuclease VapC